jgi:hypothetical protein
MSAPNYYLAELHAWLIATAQRLRAAREFATLARIEVANDIAEDAIRVSRDLVAAGHRSECYDLEAEKLLVELLENNRHLNDEERRCLRLAKTLVHRSAAADHEITELAAVSA